MLGKEDGSTVFVDRLTLVDYYCFELGPGGGLGWEMDWMGLWFWYLDNKGPVGLFSNKDHFCNSSKDEGLKW